MNLNKKLVTKEDLLSRISDVDIYRFYTNKEVSLTKRILSPLREESDPSFGYFRGEGGEICFNDFIIGGGDCIRFVQLRFGLNFYEALSKIALDFDLHSHYHLKESEKTKSNYDPKNFEDRDQILKTANNFRLGKKSRDWSTADLVFWLQFGIDIGTLKKFNVEPVQYVFINGRPIKADKHAYVFTETKDGEETYKIYQPYSKNYKWLNNHDYSVWQGWNQLPETGEELIITKSLKDVMAIDTLTEIPAISLQSEAVMPKPHIINQLKKRFKKIRILYDNDYDKEVNWGREFAKKLSAELDIVYIEFPDLYKSKDFSDLVKNHSKEKAIELLEALMDVPF